MDDSKKKQLNQIIILTVLLAGLGFSAWNAVKSVSGSRTTASAPAPEQETTQKPTTRVTAMGTIINEGDVDQSRFVEEMGLVGALNTNVFKVHQIETKRNPFSRNAGWFETELESIPGRSLPEGFLDEMTDEVPDLNAVFNTDEEFVSYRMEKVMAEDDYSFTATSEDGRITTNIQARTKTEPTIRVEYTEATGIGVEEVAQPDAAKDGQLPTIGNPWRQGTSPGDVRAPKAGETAEPFISCYGISIKGDSRSALLRLPDGSHLVHEGDVLMPGNLKVIRISESGVEIRDIRTAEQVLVPLTSPV